MALFDVDIRSADGRADVTLSGEIDLSTVEEVQTRVDAGLSDQARLVVVDLREVAFLDSSGLRMLLGIHERLRGAGGRFAVVRGPRRVARVFELTGVDEQLEVVDDPTEVSA